MGDEFKYYAFISYKREDEKWAKWLQHKLEYYKLPLTVRKANPKLPDYVRPIFKDTTDLCGGILEKAINEGLESSKYLIVICSPRAAKSQWVCKEVQKFIDLGKEENIIPFIVDGTPFSNDASECFPEALKTLSGERELLGININENGQDAAAIKVVSRMMNIGFDTLWMRYRRESKRRANIYIVLTAVFILVLLGIIGLIWNKNRLIAQQNVQISKEKTIANQERDRANAATDSIKLHQKLLTQAYDSLNKTNETLKRAFIDLAKSKRDLEVSNDNLHMKNIELAKANDAILKERNNMLITQSRFIANEVYEIQKEGDLYTSIMVALEALPDDLDNPNRPYVAEAEKALRSAQNYNHNCISVMHGPENDIVFVAYSPDGSKVAAASRDNKVYLWDTMTGGLIGEPIVGHDSWVNSVSFSPDGCHLVTASEDETVRIWDVTTGEQLAMLKEDNSGFVETAIYSHDGRKLVTTPLFTGISVWDVESGERLLSFEPAEDTVYYPYVKTFVRYAEFSPNDSLIVTACDDGTVRLWDALTGEPIGEPWRGHSKAVTTASFSPDGKSIVSASLDKTIRIWDVNTGTSEYIDIYGEERDRVFRGHEDVVYSAFYSPDGEQIVSTSFDGTIRVWNPRFNSQVAKYDISPEVVTSGIYSPDGRFILTGSHAKTLRLWDTEPQKKKPLYEYKNLSVSGYSPDLKYLVLNTFNGTKDGHIALIDSKTNDIVFEFDDKISVVKFGNTGKIFVSLSQKIDDSYTDVMIWDIATLKPLYTITNVPYFMETVFSPDDRYIAFSGNSKISVIETESGKQVHLIDAHDWFPRLTFSPDCKQLFSGSINGPIRVYDVATGREKPTLLSENNHKITDMSFSPDGRFLICPSDYLIRIFDVESGDQVKELSEDRSVIYSAKYSPNGRYIVSTTCDFIRVWEAESGLLLDTMPGCGQIAEFSQDNRYIISGKGEMVWSWMPLQDLINSTRKRFRNRSLTPEERHKYYLD